MADDELSREALLEYLRASFALTPLHQLLGLRMVPSDDGTTVVEMPVAAGAFNMSGNLHGGAIATLIDVAAGSMAARSSHFEPGKNTIVTADLHVRYLGRPKTDLIRAVARTLRAGRQLVAIEVRVNDSAGNMIAFADFAAMLVPRREPLPQSVNSDVRAPDL